MTCDEIYRRGQNHDFKITRRCLSEPRTVLMDSSQFSKVQTSGRNSLLALDPF